MADPSPAQLRLSPRNGNAGARKQQAAPRSRDKAHYRSLPAEQWRAHFRETSPAARETFTSTIGQDGAIVPCGSRAVLLQ